MKQKFIALLVCASTVVSSAFAQETGTLAKIKKDGVITLGVRESSIPFSYYDDQQKIVGYSADMCAVAVAAIKQKLNLPNLAVKEIPTTSQNRLPLIMNGTVDLECGSTTNNTDREKQVAFSDTIFVIGTRLLVKKSSGIKDFSDLAGKNVVTTAGTTSEKMLRKMNYKKSMNMNVISAKDHGEAFLTLESGRAVAFMMDDALLYGQLAKSPDAKDYEVVGKPQSYEAYGLVMRKDDPAFRSLVNDALVSAMKSGKAEDLYKKWFTSPIPPKEINLNFPMTAEVRDHFSNPNDKPYQ
ncbi:glutamate/aspartate ABC transporter substrate-binding protein [Paraburkholderia sediminicola]|uniref:glutamate/aspartate ABC transporter substrate-binding protein n=1 Tax=Paraburkholderia sediminicola TaxID=458836 RepID=UPI0038B883FC